MYIKKILVAIALITLIVGGVFAYMVYSNIFAPNTAFENDRAYLFIGSDTSFDSVMEDIAPLLKDVNSFAAVAKRKGYVTNVKPGHYAIAKGMNNNEIINSIRSKNLPVKISFNNQERLENLAGRVSAQLEIDSLSLLKVMKDPIFLKENGLNTQTALSMYLPNSYELFWNTTAEAFRDRMFKEYRRFWNNDRIAKARALKLSKSEVYTIASIVQKETAKVDERPRVAGVYLNRIRKGMRLEADPTVIYAVRSVKNNWDMQIKRVLYKDLKTVSPYNTYRNVGIPPGPIFMPDISSIDAVLNAEKHSYIFFVASVERFGYHKFAKTLTQHNANSVAYKKWINEKGIKR